MDVLLTDVESDSDFIYGRDIQRTVMTMQSQQQQEREGQSQLSSSIQGYTSFDTTFMDEDDIPTRDAGLDLSFSNGPCPLADPDTTHDASMSYRSNIVDDAEPSSSTRVQHRDPSNNNNSASKKKKAKGRSSSSGGGKRRKESEKSRNNNSLDFREKLQRLERSDFYEEEIKADDCADLPIDRRPSGWEMERPRELVVTAHNVDMLLVSARFYQQSQVVSLCKDMLLRCDVQNALYCRFVAEKHELTDIVPHLVDFVRARFTSIVNTHSFLGLGLDQLKTLLSDDGLKVHSELDVFHAARAWIDHCKHARIKHVGEVMGLVRFTLICPEDIVRHVEPHRHYFRGPGGREVLLSIYRYHALSSSQSDLSALHMDLPPPRRYIPLNIETATSGEQQKQTFVSTAHIPITPAQSQRSSQHNVSSSRQRTQSRIQPVDDFSQINVERGNVDETTTATFAREQNISGGRHGSQRRIQPVNDFSQINVELGDVDETKTATFARKQSISGSRPCSQSRIQPVNELSQINVECGNVDETTTATSAREPLTASIQNTEPDEQMLNAPNLIFTVPSSSSHKSGELRQEYMRGLSQTKTMQSNMSSEGVQPVVNSESKTFSSPPVQGASASAMKTADMFAVPKTSPVYQSPASSAPTSQHSPPRIQTPQQSGTNLSSTQQSSSKIPSQQSSSRIPFQQSRSKIPSQQSSSSVSPPESSLDIIKSHQGMSQVPSDMPVPQQNVSGSSHRNNTPPGLPLSSSIHSLSRAVSCSHASDESSKQSMPSMRQRQSKTSHTMTPETGKSNETSWLTLRGTPSQHASGTKHDSVSRSRNSHHQSFMSSQNMNRETVEQQQSERPGQSDAKSHGTKQQRVKKTAFGKADKRQETPTKFKSVVEYEDCQHTAQLHMACVYCNLKTHCACCCTWCCHSEAREHGGTNFAQGLSEKELDELEERIKLRRKEIERKGLSESRRNTQSQVSPTRIQSVTSVRIHHCRSPPCSPVCRQYNSFVTTTDTTLIEPDEIFLSETSDEDQECDDKNTSYRHLLGGQPNTASQKTNDASKPYLAEIRRTLDKNVGEISKAQNKPLYRPKKDKVPSPNHHQVQSKPRQTQRQPIEQQQRQNQRSLPSNCSQHSQGEVQRRVQPYIHDSGQDHTNPYSSQRRSPKAPKEYNFQRNNQQLYSNAGEQSDSNRLYSSLKERSLGSSIRQDLRRSSSLRPSGRPSPAHPGQDCGESYYASGQQRRRQSLDQPPELVPQGDMKVQPQSMVKEGDGQRGEEKALARKASSGEGQQTRRPRSQSPTGQTAQVRGQTLPRPRSQPPPQGRRVRSRSESHFNENARTVGYEEPSEDFSLYDMPVGYGASGLPDFPEEPPDLPEEPRPGTNLIYRHHPYTNHGAHQMELCEEEALVVAVGGLNPKMMHPEIPCRLVDSYNPATNSWFLVGKLPEARHHHGCVMLDGYLYVIGGSLVLEDDLTNMSVATNSCYRYDFGGNFWTALAPMAWPRMYHSVAVLEGVVYALGGETTPHFQQDEGDCFLDSCEYYNPDTDQWGPMASLLDGTIGAAVIGFRGLLWVIGGYVEHDKVRVVLSSVECYDPRTNSWVSMNPLPNPVCHSKLAMAQDTLFLVGGAVALSAEEPVVSVDHVLQYLEDDDVWVRFSTLSVPRHDAGCCTVGTHLFVVGGLCSQTNEVLQDLECVDVSTGEWLETLEPMSSPALGLACVAVLPEHFT